MADHPKDPVLVAAGHRGALVRWGPPRVVRIGELSADQRALVVALVDAVKAAPAVDANAGTAQRTEGHGNGTPIAD